MKRIKHISPRNFELPCIKCGGIRDKEHSYCSSCMTQYTKERFISQKFCAKCKIVKNLPYCSYCASCKKEIRKEKYNKDLDKSREYNRERYHLTRKYSKYGMSKEDYEKLLSSQDGVCAICKTKCEVNNRLSIDHDHVTLQIRGLLCAHCNKGLGLFKDNPDILEGAAKYIRDNNF